MFLSLIIVSTLTPSSENLLRQGMTNSLISLDIQPLQEYNKIIIF